jgi:hypothetical protein
MAGVKLDGRLTISSAPPRPTSPSWRESLCVIATGLCERHAT